MFRKSEIQIQTESNPNRRYVFLAIYSKSGEKIIDSLNMQYIVLISVLNDKRNLTLFVFL